MDVPSWFDTDYYLASKAALLNQQNYNGRSNWSASDVESILTSAGLTAYDHYVKYGDSEGLSPNAFFDRNFYLQEKVNQLNSQDYAGRSNWTASEVSQAFSSAGLTAYQHFSLYGAEEGLDPSASFSVQNYLTNKVNELNAGGAATWTTSSVLTAFENAGLDPVSHFILYGKNEGISPASGNAYSLTAFYDSYSGQTVLNLEGIVGSTVTAALNSDSSVAVSCSQPSSIDTLGTNHSVYYIDARKVVGAGVTLIGNSSMNILYGSSGDDTIIGGQGIDCLSGGAGADTFVFHYGSSSQNSDSYLQPSTSTSLSMMIPDEIQDFTPGTDKFSFLTSAGSESNPTKLYFGGTVSITIDASSANESATIVFANGTKSTLQMSTSNSTATLLQADYEAGVFNKDGSASGNNALGANEAVVWNINFTINYGTSTQTTSMAMLAVNDSDATFDSRDILVSLDTPYIGAYDSTTKLIASDLFFRS